MRYARFAAICLPLGALAVAAPLIMREPARAADPARCAHIGRLAESVMMLRQLEAPLSRARAMPLADENPTMRAAVETMAMRAYESPGTQGQESRAGQKTFRNQMESDCFAGRI